MTDAGDRLRLLFDWASAQRSGQRLAIWLVVALLLHGAAYLAFRITYPPAAPARVSEAQPLYILLPGSRETRRLTPYLDAADPALFAPEKAHGTQFAPPVAPAYEPSYASAKPQLVPLPDVQPRVLPPLVRDVGPVPMPAGQPPAARSPIPAAETQIELSGALAGRAPRQWPAKKFTARPGDQLAPTRFLIAVAPDGRVLHVFRGLESIGDDNKALDDRASRYLMSLWFGRAADSAVAWGAVTFHWGLDVKREELH